MSDDSFRQEIAAAIEAHSTWKERLRKAAENNETTLPVDDICRDDKCRFGKWLSTVPANERNRKHLHKVKTLHQEFHVKAGDIARRIASGNTSMAIAGLNGAAFNTKSSELSAALRDWQANG